jgi:protein phosphatase 2C family protein 2/3
MYVANVGDSRAVLSSDGGAITKDLSVDHKPGDERERIQLAGGRVYQTNIANLPSTFTFAGIKIVTPFRVFPGKLSVFF